MEYAQLYANRSRNYSAWKRNKLSDFSHLQWHWQVQRTLTLPPARVLVVGNKVSDHFSIQSPIVTLPSLFNIYVYICISITVKLLFSSIRSDLSCFFFLFFLLYTWIFFFFCQSLVIAHSCSYKKERKNNFCKYFLFGFLQKHNPRDQVLFADPIETKKKKKKKKKKKTLFL